MSSTTHHLTAPPAPWRSQFLTHISKMESPEFVLSTLSPAPPSQTSSSTPPTPYLPRARYCIYRGLWASLPENKHNDAPKNDPVYDSDLPTFTTDVRMEKVPELFATGPGRGERSQAQGSGGGGPVEAVWWVKDVSVQWRMKGVAWVIAPDIEGSSGDESSGVRSVKSAVGARMRVLKPGSEGSWSWARELTGHFGNVSPGMRGSFRNPPPGTPVKGEPDEEHKLGQKVGDLEDGVARANFRVVVIMPDEVESVDLSDPATARRKRYTFVEGDGKGEWKEEELWP